MQHGTFTDTRSGADSLSGAPVRTPAGATSETAAAKTD